MNAEHQHHATKAPIVTSLQVIPVAGHDSMLLNLSGAHGPFFTRNIVILKDSSGNVGVGEVDAFFAVRINDHELCQLRADRNQLREVVTALMAVARVQARLDPWLSRFGVAGSLGLVACGFGSAWGCHVQFIPQKQSRASP